MNENKRLESLDAFRGFDMMWIMGASSILAAICSLFPGGENCFLVQQMDHVKWHGLAFMDLIFPTFLFIAGISFPYSFAKQKSLGHSSSQIHLKIFKRAFLLVLLGLLYNGILSDFTLSNIRFCSVLGRIGLAWMLAALLFVHFSKGVRAGICAFLLIGYFLLLRLCIAPGAPAGADPFSFEWNIAGWLDSKIIPGRLYFGSFDPEGLLGVIPACATAMLGMFTGEFVRESKLTGERKSLYMFLASLALLALGLVWNIFFPINKMLWSSSFVCVVGAYSLCLFSIFYYVIDVKGHRRWAFPFKVIGLNSITIYLAMEFINFGFTTRALLGGTMALLPEAWGHLLFCLGAFLLRWAFLYFLYKKKIFLKV